jgi:hypothetical protein
MPAAHAFSFERSNNDSAGGVQAVGLGSINYTVVPKSNGALFGVASCAGAVLCEFLRRKQAKGRLKKISHPGSRISK